MSAIETRYEHIFLDENNVPMISNSTMKVIELGLFQKAYGWSPEELHFQHPHLSLGQIYSALAYCWDHHETFEMDIKERLHQIKQIEKSKDNTLLERRLRAKGLV